MTTVTTSTDTDTQCRPDRCPRRMDVHAASSIYPRPPYGVGSLATKTHPSVGAHEVPEHGYTSPIMTGQNGAHSRPTVVQRPVTSPAVQAESDSDFVSASLSDSKKRNKLGYHRTAVACGHCRRRKIRCIPSADGASSRCANCIRLKKECHFYPVDQTIPAKKNRSDTKSDASGNDPDGSVSSSSPGTQTTETFESASIPHPGGSIHGMARADGANLYPGDFDYSSQYDPNSWDMTSPSSTTSPYLGVNGTHASSADPAYWMTAGAVAPGGFSGTPYEGQPDMSPRTHEVQFGFSGPHSSETFPALQTHAPGLRATNVSVPGPFQPLYRSSTYPNMDRRMSTAENVSYMPNQYNVGLNIHSHGGSQFATETGSYPSWTGGAPPVSNQMVNPMANQLGMPFESADPGPSWYDAQADGHEGGMSAAFASPRQGGRPRLPLRPR